MLPRETLFAFSYTGEKVTVAAKEVVYVPRNFPQMRNVLRRVCVFVWPFIGNTAID